MIKEAENNRLVNFRLDDEDIRMLSDQAAKIGVNKTQYFRYLIRVPIETKAPGNVIVLDKKTLLRMRNELRHWGHHYNQGIHALNNIQHAYRKGTLKGDYFEDQIELANARLKEVSEAAEAIDKKLEEISRMPTVRS